MVVVLLHFSACTGVYGPYTNGHVRHQPAGLVERLCATLNAWTPLLAGRRSIALLLKPCVDRSERLTQEQLVIVAHLGMWELEGSAS